MLWCDGNTRILAPSRTQRQLSGVTTCREVRKDALDQRMVMFVGGAESVDKAQGL